MPPKCGGGPRTKALPVLRHRCPGSRLSHVDIWLQSRLQTIFSSDYFHYFNLCHLVFNARPSTTLYSLFILNGGTREGTLWGIQRPWQAEFVKAESTRSLGNSVSEQPHLFLPFPQSLIDLLRFSEPLSIYVAVGLVCTS